MSCPAICGALPDLYFLGLLTAGNPEAAAANSTSAAAGNPEAAAADSTSAAAGNPEAAAADSTSAAAGNPEAAAADSTSAAAGNPEAAAADSTSAAAGNPEAAAADSTSAAAGNPEAAAADSTSAAAGNPEAAAAKPTNAVDTPGNADSAAQCAALGRNSPDRVAQCVPLDKKILAGWLVIADQISRFTQTYVKQEQLMMAYLRQLGWQPRLVEQQVCHAE